MLQERWSAEANPVFARGQHHSSSHGGLASYVAPIRCSKPFVPIPKRLLIFARSMLPERIYLEISDIHLFLDRLSPSRLFSSMPKTERGISEDSLSSSQRGKLNYNHPNSPFCLSPPTGEGSGQAEWDPSSSLGGPLLPLGNEGHAHICHFVFVGLFTVYCFFAAGAEKSRMQIFNK